FPSISRMRLANSSLLGLLVAAILQTVSSITCFVWTTSTVRRDVKQIVPGRSELACQAVCVNDPSCTAIQITTDGNCVIFGAVTTATFEQCPIPITCQVK
ncbi:hypothetical protein PMAYCL1PPCAC_05376, partial [Pristionchus mayeri]